MAGPWEKYAQPAASAAPAAPAGPWAKYAQTAAPQQAAEAPPGFMQRAGAMATDLVGSVASGARKGLTNLAGLPVELVNAAPMVGNILPGEQGIGPISDNPVGGAASLDALLRVGGTVPAYEPQTTAGRYAERIAEEGSATIVPVAAGLHAARKGVDAARRLNPIVRPFVEPFAVAPGRVVAREMLASGAAGTGAQFANEMVTPDGEGTWWSDLLGSMGGVAGLDVARVIGGVGKYAAGAAMGNTGAFDDVAGEVVASRLIDSSTEMQDAYSRFGREGVNPNDLARRLETPSGAETQFPGFKADIADRAQDPGISVMAYNTNTVLPGAAAARRNANAGVVDDWFQQIAPEGNAAELRAYLAQGAEQRIADANANVEGVRGATAAMDQAVTPSMSPTDRGYAIRSGLANTAAAENQSISDLYGQIDESVPIDPAALNQRVQGVTENLPLNDRDRFQPSETRTAAKLVPEEQGPTPTGLLDMYERPIMREPAQVEVPVSEAMSIRSGLSSDLRSPAATDQQRRVTGQYLDEVDSYIRSALPDDQRGIMEQAKAARLDYGRRFEDRGAVPDILRETGRGQYRMADETVPGRALRGETDYRAVMAEAGGDDAARKAVADQILADAQRTNALRSPEALSRFARDRNFALKDFPELKPALERAGVSRRMLADAEAQAAKTAKDMAPGGNSATGQYLRYDDTGTRQAIKTAWNSDQPERAVRELLDVAGDTPKTRSAAKAALWEEVSATGKLSARTETGDDGVTRWSGRKLNELMTNPKFARTADLLWSDDPEHLANVRAAAEALAGAENSLRGKASSASGTAQSLGGKMDPALSTASIASRMRSVNRGQLSPTIAIIDVASTALRNRSAKTQAKAIDEMLARAINDPEFAAALLRKHNPADEAAAKRAFLGRFGVRLPTVANIMAGSDDDEDDALRRAMEAE